jgi:hypothetical protein
MLFIIRDKLKSYKKYIDPQKYKTLHKQLNILEKQNERAVERLNIKPFNENLLCVVIYPASLYVLSQVCSIRRAVIGRNTVGVTAKFITCVRWSFN